MTAKEKCDELMARMNGQIVTKEIWDKASDYAKQDLKRKALIVVEEILGLYWNDVNGIDYWNSVKTEINAL